MLLPSWVSCSTSYDLFVISPGGFEAQSRCCLPQAIFNLLWFESRCSDLSPFEGRRRGGAGVIGRAGGRNSLTVFYSACYKQMDGICFICKNRDKNALLDVRPEHNMETYCLTNSCRVKAFTDREIFPVSFICCCCHVPMWCWCCFCFHPSHNDLVSSNSTYIIVCVLV